MCGFLGGCSSTSGPISAARLVRLLSRRKVAYREGDVCSSVGTLGGVGIPILDSSNTGGKFCLGRHTFRPTRVGLLVSTIGSTNFVAPGGATSLARGLGGLLSMGRTGRLASRMCYRITGGYGGRRVCRAVGVLSITVGGYRGIGFRCQAEGVSGRGGGSCAIGAFIISPCKLI